MSKTLILYYAPTACSIAPHIALEEVGAAFEPRRIDLANDEQSSSEFLKLSPLGRVPAMIIDGEAVTEVPALLAFVASLKPEAGLTPPPGTLAYARCFEWLGFLSSSLHVAYAQFRRPQRFLAEGSPGWDELSGQGRLNTIRLYREVERRLTGSWAAGDFYSIADINLFPFFTWAWRLEFDVRNECPRWADLFDRLKERPAVRRALEREGIEV
jgi:glutathione S-transferase